MCQPVLRYNLDPTSRSPFQLRLLQQGLPLRDRGAEGAVRAHQAKQGQLLTRSKLNPAFKMRRRAGVGAIQKKRLEGAMYKDKGNELQGGTQFERKSPAFKSFSLKTT